MPVVPRLSFYFFQTTRHPLRLQVAWCQPVSSEGPPVSDFCRRDRV
jgi:hypothetical protein